MRFYNIAIANIQTGNPILMADGTAFGPYSSTTDGTISGRNIPGALNVEFDIPVVDFATPCTDAWLCIHGVGLKAVGQATQFNPNFTSDPSGTNYPATCGIKLYGGMRAGLPLATAAAPFSGLLLQAQIQQGYGNWQGTDQTLEFVLAGPYGSPSNAKNITFQWQVGQNLADAVAITLINAFPGSEIISNCRALQNPWGTVQAGQGQSLEQFAQYLLNTSQSIIQGNYLGLRIVPTPNGFTLFDGTVRTPAVQLKITDLIGQPTWKDVATISFKTPMRADLSVNDYVQLPRGPQILSPQSNSAYRTQSIFQASYQISAVRHLGHFRQKSADAWVTCFDAVIVPPTATVTVGAPVLQ